MLSLNTESIWFVPISFVLSAAVTRHCTPLWLSEDSPRINLLASMAAPRVVFPLPREASSAA